MRRYRSLVPATYGMLCSTVIFLERMVLLDFLLRYVCARYMHDPS